MVRIQIERLVKRYPKTTDLVDFVLRPWRRETILALDGVDLDLEEGRIHGLVGVNGAGKTTLLKILAGLVLPTDGRVIVDGVERTHDSESLRRTVGFVVADERSFYWRLSVHENLRFFATLQGFAGAGRRRRIQDCLERVGLASYAQRTFGSLSTGLRQRLAIARGLLADPPILLMDEATRSLDPEAAHVVRELVRGLVADRPERLVVYSSHDLPEIQKLCHDVAVIHAGRLVAFESLTSAAWNRLRYRIRTREPLSAEVFDGLPGVELERTGEREARVGLDEVGALEVLVERLRARGLGLEEAARIETHLEDLFLSHVRSEGSAEGST